jgi:hypothetical protein
MTKPDKRCGTCKWYEPADEERGLCGNPALTLGKEKLSCAGQYHGGRLYWEPKPRSWWPFGRR